MLKKLIIGLLSLLALISFAPTQVSAKYCDGTTCKVGNPPPGQKSCTNDADCGGTGNYCNAPYEPTVSGNACYCQVPRSVGGSCGISWGCNTGFKKKWGWLYSTCTCVPDKDPGPGYCVSNVYGGSGPIRCPGGIQTGLGCIPVEDRNEFGAWFLGWAIGAAGGIAFLMILYSGFQIMTAAGDPQKLQTGRETLTAAVSGLILIIFSAYLLRLIGVTILRIPGF